MSSFNYKRFLNNFRKSKGGNIILFFIVIQVVAITFGLIFPDKFAYISKANILVLFKAIPQIGVIALGVNLLMIAGEFDLTVGAIFTFSAFVMSILYAKGIPILLAILISLITGAIIGFINGIVVTKTKAPSFIITLGFMYVWRGMILAISGAQNQHFEPPDFIRIVLTGSFGFVQMQIIWMIIIALICYFILEKHKLGNQIFAVGGNANTAKTLGVDVDRVKIITFILVGTLAAFSGLISTTRVEAIGPMQGEGLELQAIAACVVGGTSLSGGRGSVAGAFFGAAILYTMQDILLLLRAPGFYLQLFIGLIIVLAVIINRAIQKE